MKLVNNGRKNFSTKAQYEREPLAGCCCSSGSYSNQTTNKTINSQCVCQCDWRYKSNNGSTGKAGASRDGKNGSSSTIYYV